MAELKLYIGNKNYSSWSMRAWLVLRKADLPFTEEMILLDVPGFKEKLLAISDAGTVPVLNVGTEIIPDSLAISDWLALAVPNLWPRDPIDRQKAREFCQLMQTDFGELRTHASMDLRKREQAKLPKPCLDDAVKLDGIWQDLLSKHDGPFLFEDWSIADAFSTPYATRFVSYDIPRSQKTDTYISELMADEEFLEWEAEALIKPWELPDH